VSQSAWQQQQRASDNQELQLAARVFLKILRIRKVRAAHQNLKIQCEQGRAHH
jgi:hypothetical protein